MTVRVAVAGAGAIGEIVARDIYPDLTTVALTAVVDPDLDRAARVAKHNGARAAAALVDVLDEIDAVDVRVPHHVHAEVALTAIEHGKHVLVEKPIATTVEDARRIVDAARAAGVVLAVAENYPHLRAVQDARSLLAENAIGRPLAVRSTRAYQLDGVWRRDWREGTGPAGGILLDQGTHQVSLIRQLAGPVVAVSAVGSHETLALTLQLESGITAQSLLTWQSPGTWDQTEATVFGETGRLDVVVDYEQHLGGCALWTPDRNEQRGAENYYASHASIVNDWATAIQEHRDPLVHGDEGLADLAAVLAAANSLEENGAFVEVSPSRRSA
ncbi:Gfo/Idh/MocA family protein [Kribbella italica]|uniref:Putative dehydrogenase n=1 Tax=Kribbella italica TaxID=1540520 RepID=A0A7W9MTS0_9ACTN|nr:Gfo/Idh/MocA family oxidoreductase [Kribbella italica]MBB5835502.1 putative dehydrogenase [Kribbella italica]